MNIKPIDIPPPFKYNNVSFGIYKGSSKKPYGEYMWGEYKGNKVEVFDAFISNQKLIYISRNMRFLKSKLIYWVNGIKKIARAEGRL